ncbi:hypothetical protein B296_00021341 [Ensete ventricosum]|uniref:Uncharacterized protein n=1 Tax=Ensete ventricosum TaxID=4639 RepID=A0A427AUH7_ENSVE|nr:hypothetical protein B296_00021341 [Ensete ventricosum]
MVVAIDAGCYDWGDDKMVHLLMEEKAAGEKEEAASNGGWGSNCCYDWSHRQRWLWQREEKIGEADVVAPAPVAATPTPVAAARGCGRGWLRYCEAAVEEATTSAFGVAEAIGEGVE